MEESGSHTGSGDATALNDATKSWTTDAWVGYWVVNLTDGSRGRIAGNTADTITAVLGGGDENDWDVGDAYKIVRAKSPLVAGEAATFDNYTSYSLGINGVMIDIAGLPARGIAHHGRFSFRVGNSDTPESWQTLAEASIAMPAIAQREISMDQPGVSRVSLVWPDAPSRSNGSGATVLATPNTGLTAADDFFGTLPARRAIPPTTRWSIFPT